MAFILYDDHRVWFVSSLFSFIFHQRRLDHTSSNMYTNHLYHNISLHTSIYYGQESELSKKYHNHLQLDQSPHINKQSNMYIKPIPTHQIKAQPVPPPPQDYTAETTAPHPA